VLRVEERPALRRERHHAVSDELRREPVRVDQRDALPSGEPAMQIADALGLRSAACEEGRERRKQDDEMRRCAAASESIPVERQIVLRDDVIDHDTVAGIEEAARHVARRPDEERPLTFAFGRAITCTEAAHTQKVAQRFHIDVQHAVVALAERLRGR